MLKVPHQITRLYFGCNLNNARYSCQSHLRFTNVLEWFRGIKAGVQFLAKNVQMWRQGEVGVMPRNLGWLAMSMLGMQGISSACRLRKLFGSLITKPRLL